jgi:hypothetical protein
MNKDKADKALEKTFRSLEGLIDLIVEDDDEERWRQLLGNVLYDAIIAYVDLERRDDGYLYDQEDERA